MNYYDIKYKAPDGNIGIHYHVKALTKQEALRNSQVLLSSGTFYKPEEFYIIETKKVSAEQYGEQHDRICN